MTDALHAPSPRTAESRPGDFVRRQPFEFSFVERAVERRRGHGADGDELIAGQTGSAQPRVACIEPAFGLRKGDAAQLPHR